MKANQLTDPVYSKLVSLYYARKVNYLHQATQTDFSYLDFEVLREAIQSFPELEIDVNTDLMSIDYLDGEQQFYLFRTNSAVFLVDTQGYNYPRYITKLVNYDEEDQDASMSNLDYMDGMIRLNDEEIFNACISNMIFDLKKESDFTKNELLEFLQFKVDEAFDKIKFM